MNRTLQLIVMVAVFASAAFSPTTTLAADTKRSVEDWMKGAKFILGVYNVEDLLAIPGTRWIVGSGLHAYNAGFVDPVIKKNYLHLFDAKAETGRRIEPEEIVILPALKMYPGSTPPDWEVFGPHGIDLGPREGDVVTLYAVNHGGREAIEIFKIDVSQDTPRFVWVGNVVVPAECWPDAVVHLPDTGGFIATAMSNPLDPEGSYQKMLKGEPVGCVKEWNTKTGWSTLPGTEIFSTPNGIVVNEDGSMVWVGQSSGFRVSRIKRGGADPDLTEVDLGAPIDNLRWSADGQSILVAVHTVDPDDFEHKQMAATKVGGNLLTTFNITRLDPDTMKTEIYMPSGVYGQLGAGTTGIEVGDRFWVGSTKADRIGIFDLKR